MHDPATDDEGYLVGNLLAITGRLSNGEFRTLFRRDFLERALWSFGEDACLSVVQQGLTSEQVRSIGLIDYELSLADDPQSKSGAGYPGDRALATAAVEVLTGERRLLARKRRRPQPK